MNADFLHKKILILGAGREGLSTARYLRHLRSDADITVADLEEREVDAAGAQTLFGTHYPTSLEQWDLVVVSPGIPPQTPLLRTARFTTTATNIFLDDVQGTVVAVTGSKGKSTTSALIAHILAQHHPHVHCVGNIGAPALDALREHNTNHDLFVYELSSYQASRLVAGPDVAIIMNLFPEHLDYHGGREQYYRDKLRVAMTQTENDVVIYNANNSELARRIADAPSQKIAWPDERGAHIENDALYYGADPILPLSELKLPGAHNAENCLGAITVANYFQVPHAVIAAGLRSFTPLAHRLEYVGTFQGITFYDDAISTTPESTIAALRALPKTGTLILGGQDRGYDFTQLAQLIADKKIPTLIFFPDSGATIREAIARAGYTPEHLLETRSMEEAVRFAYDHTPTGMICLLSCASPSYSIFKNFEDKGEQFQNSVKA